ncbi:MAG: sigma-70 family RNA polymerase sigma factor [Planctomycetota bacterium]
MTGGIENQLHAHVGGLRALACTLVGAQGADDLVQDTVLQALRHRSAAVHAPGVWLATVMRFVAHKLRRGERRRVARERLVARPEAVTPDSGVETREAFHRLHAAVAALPEPYQTTILLRYLRELAPTEVAAAMQVPVATVKTRLVRGLALLRERFDAEERTRGGDWRAGLAGAFGLERVMVGTAALAAGGLLMTTAMKWMAGTIVAAAAVAAFVWFGEPPTLRPPASVAGTGVASDAAVGSLPKGVGGAADGVRVPDRTLAAGATVAADARARIHGRLVDEHGAPLPGLGIELRGTRIDGGMGKDFEREYGEWLLARGGRRFATMTARTASDGRFEFVVEPTPLSLTLWVRRGTLEHVCGLGQIDTAKDRPVGDLVVPIACTLRCRVVDELGRVVTTPDVAIEFDHVRVPREMTADWLFHRYPDVAVAMDGVVTTTVAAGPHRCDVRGRRIVRGPLFEVPVGAVAHAHQIVVANAAGADTITGTVVDERGRALTGVEVTGWNKTASQAATDALGRFTLQRDGQPDGEVQMDFAMAGHDPTTTPRTLTWGARDVCFVLRDLVAIEIRVVDERGEPVVDFGVRAWRAPEDRGAGPRIVGGMQASGEHEHGIASIPVPPGRHLVVVEPHRWDLWRSESVAVEAVREHVARVEVRLARAADRALLVRRRDGAPVPKAKVEEIAADALAPQPVTIGTKTVTIDRWDPPYPRSWCMLLHDTSTNARGEANLHGSAGKDVVVRISGDGFAPFLVGPLRLDARDPVVATVPIGGTLIARVGPAEFVQQLLVVRERQHPGAGPGFRLQRGRGDGAELVPPAALSGAAIDSEGRFSIAGVPAGDWQLALEPWDDANGQILVWSGNGVPFATVTLREGEATEARFDLGAWLPATITGVVRCNGAPVANERIGVEVARPHPDQPRGMRTMTYAETDAEGRFLYRGRPGDVRVLLNRADLRRRDQGINWIRSQTVATLPANGAVEQSFDVVVATVRIRLLAADGSPVPETDVVLCADQTNLVHRLGPSDANGCIVGELEPGEFVVQWGEPRTAIGRITAGIADPPRVELRLPAGARSR